MDNLDVTGYHDDDDDEEEFERADRDENMDYQYGGTSKFFVGNKGNKQYGRGRNRNQKGSGR